MLKSVKKQNLKTFLFALVIGLICFGIPSLSLNAAASFTNKASQPSSIDPAAEVVAGQIQSEHVILEIGDFTATTAIGDVSFEVERNGTRVVGPRVLGAAFTESLYSFNPAGPDTLANRLEVRHYFDGVWKVSFYLDLRPDEQGHIDLGADLIAQFRYRIFGEDEGPGGPVIPAGNRDSTQVQLLNQFNENQNQSRSSEGQAVQEFEAEGGADDQIIQIGGGNGSGSGGPTITTWSDTYVFDVDATSFMPSSIALTSIPAAIPYADASNVSANCHAGGGLVTYEETLFEDAAVLDVASVVQSCVGGSVSFSTQLSLDDYPTANLARFRVSQESYGDLVFDEGDAMGAGNQAPSISLNSPLVYPAGTQLSVQEILIDANTVITDPEEGSLPLSSLVINGGTLNLGSSILFEPGNQYDFSLVAFDSQGLPSTERLLEANTSVTQLTVIPELPANLSTGVAEKPELTWRLEDGSGVVLNPALLAAPYSYDDITDDLEFAISTSTVADPGVVDSAYCRSTAPTTLSFTESDTISLLPREFTFTDLSLPHEQHVVWCVALVRRVGLNTFALTEYSDSQVFTVRPENIPAPLIGTLPSTTEDSPTGSPVITLVASGGEPSAVARFYQKEGSSLIELGSVPYNENNQAFLEYEVQNTSISQEIDFAATSLRDGTEEGPLSLFVRLHYDANLLLSAPKLDEHSAENDGIFRVFDIRSEATEIEVWRRVAAETCDAGIETCWQTVTPFKRISLFERANPPAEVTEITADSLVFEDTEFAALDPGPDFKGISYFVSVRSADASSLRSNSISEKDQKAMAGLGLGDPVLIGEPSGFSATFYINNTAGYPENSADWIAKVQYVDLPDPSISCGSIQFDSGSPTLEGSFDSLSRVNDPDRNLSNAIKTLDSIPTTPNVKTCVSVCVSDRSNTEPDDLRCFVSQVVAQDLEPANFDGLVDLQPAPSGTGAIGFWDPPSDDPSEPLEFLEAQFSVTTKFNDDGSPDFSGVNPVIIEDVSESTAVFEGLTTGSKVAAKLEVLDEGGNKTGGPKVITGNLFDNRPQISDARLQDCTNCQAWEKELVVEAYDRNQGEELSIVAFAVVGGRSTADQFLAQSLSEQLIEGAALQSLLFPLGGASGTLNSLSIDGTSQVMELSVGMDLSALLTADELDQQEFMVVVEDSAGLRGSFSTGTNQQGDFAQANDIGRNASSAGCLFSSANARQSSPAGILIIGFVLFLLWRQTKTRQRGFA